jgi:hypothetical protein
MIYPNEPPRILHRLGQLWNGDGLTLEVADGLNGLGCKHLVTSSVDAT